MQRAAALAFDEPARGDGHLPSWPEVAWDEPRRQACVAALYLSLGESRGIVTRDALGARLRSVSKRPASLLARWIEHRQVVHFRWRSETWLPLFQFDPLRLEVRAPVASVLGELAGVFDDLELAEWFASSNSWLQGAVPASAIARQPRAVIDAARADRFIARG